MVDPRQIFGIFIISAQSRDDFCQCEITVLFLLIVGSLSLNIPQKQTDKRSSDYDQKDVGNDF